MRQRMKRNFLQYILGLWVMVCGCWACTDQEVWEKSLLGEEVWVNLEFSHQDFDKVDITTRATLDIRQESRVLNMFVFLFTADGERIYSHYFDKDNREENKNTVTGADRNCWYVNTADDGKTTGTVRIKAPTVTNAILYLVANLDEDMMNVSSERLNTVRTLDELESLNVTLMQHTVSRNGYFPMTAKLTGVRVNTTSIEAGTAYLERLDAKVTVNVKLASNKQLKAFIPDVCRIRKIAAGSRVANATATADFEEAGYFDSEVTFDEQSTTDGNVTSATCSFYLLENRESANLKNQVGNYHDRDRRIKNTSGSYNTENGWWLNAPENATFLEIHGELQMEINTAATGMQELIGDVTYYVHLGDFAKSINNYDVLRNTHYTYNITIHGVDKITAEVETEVEDQSGATGHVYSATESHYTFDAHYGQRVFSFKAEEIGTDAMTFYVKTPFGREGTPQLPGGGYNISDLDYQWVSFLINKIDPKTGCYSLNNRIYPGDNNEMLIAEGSSERLMNIAELLDFVKTEKVKYTTFKESGFVGENPSRFLPNAQGEYEINITAFVDEYYYDKHPTENKSISWKDFVNQPNRLMHILCDTKTSLDGASSITGSVITLRQRSIQTPYNITKSDLHTAFGCETVDETREDYLTFYENDDNYRNTNFSNNSDDNGLYNTARLWNMFNNNAVKTGNNREKWNTYLNYEIPNREDGKTNHFMKDDVKSMRYAPMSRNRDNNGNGYIDPEEVRWYIAPLEQLYALYIGDLGIASEAQLYPASLAALPKDAQVNGKSLWRNHIVCSNQTNTGAGQYISQYFPEMLWAEEGVSVSGYNMGPTWNKPAPHSIRCLRNLGMDDATTTSLADDEQNVPEPMVVATPVSNQVYSFDLSNVNDKSVRYFTTHELIPDNENGESSRTYYGFETANSFTNYQGGYEALKEDLENGESPCPDGYRVPNVREGALMSMYCSSTWWNSTIILGCSYYSHGIHGTNYDNGRVTWYYQNKYVTIDSSSEKLRCVKDLSFTNN